MKAALILVGLALLAVSVSGLAPLYTIQERVEGEYVVVLKNGLTADHLASHIATLRNDFLAAEAGADNEVLDSWYMGESFAAFHARLSDDMVAKERARADVAYIESNGIVHVAEEIACTTQSSVIWNLARVNERNIDLVTDDYYYDYDGSGVDVYIVDTGILTTHNEFGGRAKWGTNTAGDGQNRDCNGHGTHVAGTVAGTLYGVAKKSTVIAVKVLSCSGSGTNAGVINGVNWVANQAGQSNRKAVANMSLGGGYSLALNQAVDAAVEADVVFAVAAGNDNKDACNYSPASATKAISVGATTIVREPNYYESDQRTSFSNFGSCVDILAPGQVIKAAWMTSNTATNTISGTSMASPHVAGAAAVLRSGEPGLTAEEVKLRIINDATNGVIDLACSSAACRSTPNKLLYTATCYDDVSAPISL